jgi:hypothetical protein
LNPENPTHAATTYRPPYTYDSVTATDGAAVARVVRAPGF